MDLIAGDNSLKVGSYTFNKGSLFFVENDDETITVTGLGLPSFKLVWEKTTNDGEPFSDRDALVAFLEANLFKSGGGDGSGVTWDDVQDKPLKELSTPITESEGLVPVYTQEGQLPVGVPEFPENAVPLALLDTRVPNLNADYFLVGGNSGNIGRKLLPKDLNITATNRIPSVGTDGLIGSVPFSSGGMANSVAVRRGTGGLSAEAGIVDIDLINLGQFKGIVNDTLTNGETSATLQVLYANAVIGTTITAPTALVEYRKYSVGLWKKNTIQIV